MSRAATLLAPSTDRGAASGGERGPIDRLTAPDLMLVWPEERGWPQDIGALGRLGGDELLDSAGRFKVEVARERIEQRLNLVPRFRQVMRWPRRGLGWPAWVDYPAFDIAEHVGVFPVLPPGDETQLLNACEKLRRRPLNRSRPLWEMWFLTGLPNRRVGFFIRVHHAIADGVAGVATLGALVDPVPDPPAMKVLPWTPGLCPTDRELFQDNLRRRRHELGRALSALVQPRRTIRRMRDAWPALREIFAEGRAPRSSLNRSPIGSDRRVAVIRTKLDVVKAIAHAHDAKINDVLLTAVAGGYAELLRGRKEAIDGLVLRAFVPVSLHGRIPGRARGNVDGGMLVPLPIGEADDVVRLRLIATETAMRKKKNRPPAGTVFRTIFLQRLFLRLMPRQRFMNAYVANVPGPPISVFFAGAPLLELFPIIPLTANISVGVGALSYAGEFNITVVGDRDLCPDLEHFIRGMRRSFETLESRTLEPRSCRQATFSGLAGSDGVLTDGRAGPPIR